MFKKSKHIHNNSYISYTVTIIVFKFYSQKYLEMEDSVEGEKKDLQEKIESLESIVRMLELKSKNAADHGENKIHMWLV